jgi:hypothetical protein
MVTICNPVRLESKKMPIVLIPFLILFYSSFSFSQSISGHVLDRTTSQPLAFVSIGLIETNRGTITNEDGSFNLLINGISSEAMVRFSMVGYESQTIVIKDLVGHANKIQLKEQPVKLKEVIVRSTKPKRWTIGTKTSNSKVMTGWGGCGNCSENLGGIERGIKIEISKPVFVEGVNFHVAYFGYDSMLLRLHIRKIENDFPAEELLTDNIYLRVKSTGWAEIDLTKYNLFFTEDLAVSLEWVKAWGKTKDRENALKLSVKMFKGTLFSKDAIEGHWSAGKHASPGIYLTVQDL